MYFGEDDTQVNPAKLIRALKAYNSSTAVFVGHALQDKVHSIIHHYHDPATIKFPDFAAGWVISTKLLRRVVKKLAKEPLKADFTIDPQHEVYSLPRVFSGLA